MGTDWQQVKIMINLRVLTKIILLTVLLVKPIDTFAQYSFNAETESTSDNIDRVQLGVKYTQKRQSIVWPYLKEPSRGDKMWGAAATYRNIKLPGQQFTGSDVIFDYGVRLADNLHLTLGGGIDQLKTEEPSENHSQFKPVASVDWMVNENLFWSLAYTKDFTYQDLIVNVSTLEVLTSDIVSGNMLWRNLNWRLPFRFNERWLSDGNRRFDGDIELKYAIDQENNWIWVGAGAYYVTAEKKAGYWSPSNSLSVGPRLEFSVKALEPDLNVYGEVDYNFIKEEDVSNQGYALRLGLVKGDRNNSQFKFSGFVIDSTQNGAGWKTKGLSFEMQF